MYCCLCESEAAAQCGFRITFMLVNIPSIDGPYDYLCALPVLAIGSAGVAAAQSIPSLLFCFGGFSVVGLFLNIA